VGGGDKVGISTFWREQSGEGVVPCRLKFPSQGKDFKGQKEKGGGILKQERQTAMGKGDVLSLT